AIDISVRRTRGNGARVWWGLAKFAALWGDLRAADLSRPGVISQIAIAPSRIDIITESDAVEFELAWPRRMMTTVAGKQIPVLGRADLIVNKRASGRPKDLADLAWLESESRRG